jgi:ABC-type transport system substrate-binding protein
VAVVDEPTTKFAGLASGDLDLAGISPAMASLADGDPALALVTYPVAFTNTIVFNTTRPPFSDARVRRAIAAIIDRQRIVDVAVSGLGVAAQGPIPLGHPMAAAMRETAAADSLLDAAGFVRRPDGTRYRDTRPLRLVLRTVGSGDNAVEQLVQSDLRRHGIEVEIQQMELGAFLRDARSAEKPFDALVTGIPGDVSLSHLASMFASTQAGGALDYAGFHRPALDSLFAEARAAVTLADERAAWLEIQRYLAAEAPVVWLYHARGVQGKRRRLTGVTMDLRGELVTLVSWSLSP